MTAAKEQLLVVNRDALEMWRLGRWFTSRGYQVTAANSIATAVTMAQQQQVDLLVTFLQPPHFDSLAMVQEVARAHPNSLIVVHGPKLSPELRGRCLSAGALWVTGPSASPAELEVVVGACRRLVRPEQPAAAQELLRALLDGVSRACSGVVMITDEQFMGRVFLVGDKIAWAYIPGWTQQITAKLCERLEIELSELVQLFRRCAQTNENFAEALTRSGRIEHEHMYSLQLEVVAQNICEMLLWRSPRIRFLPQQWSYGSQMLYGIHEVVSRIVSLQQGSGAGRAVALTQEVGSDEHEERSRKDEGLATTDAAGH